jgi:hypothetical protein
MSFLIIAIIVILILFVLFLMGSGVNLLINLISMTKISDSYPESLNNSFNKDNIRMGQQKGSSLLNPVVERKGGRKKKKK